MHALWAHSRKGAENPGRDGAPLCVVAVPRVFPALFPATSGDLTRSARWREVFGPLGFGDDLRVALVVDSKCWGYLALHRRAARPPFTEAEEEYVGGPAAEAAGGSPERTTQRGGQSHRDLILHQTPPMVQCRYCSGQGSLTVCGTPTWNGRRSARLSHRSLTRRTAA
jgi:GAF domain